MILFTGPLKIKRAINIIEPLQRLVVAARKNEVPVIYSIDAHYPQDVEVIRKWGNHAIKGTAGAQVIPELKPDETKDYIVEKTDLQWLLRNRFRFVASKPVQRRGSENCGAGWFAYSHVCTPHVC